MTPLELATAALTLLPRILDLIERQNRGHDDEALYRFVDVLEKSIDKIVEADTEDKRHEAAFDLANSVKRIR
jgi:CRISPR/Cas system CSM-associated protein Csm2 small subunit